MNRVVRITGLMCLALMIVILSGCGATGSIEGYVYVPSGAHMDRLMGGREIPTGNQPVPDAVVTCTGFRGSVQTDSTGYFRIDGVKVGTQTVTMSRAQFGAATATVTVLQDQLSAITGDEGLLKKKWTMLVYLDADNNLGWPDKYGQTNDYALLDVNEMEQVGSTDDVNVLVQWDRPSNHTSWTTTRRYYVTRGTTYDVDSKMLADLGEQDMSNPETLKSFLVWGMTNYPADNYIVVLWNHGGGVYPRSHSRTRQPLANKTKGVCWDDTTGTGAFDCLTTDELKAAFTDAETVTGKHLAVLDFDVCLMNMAEVMYGLNGIFDYVVGSEEVTPGTGNPYNDILENLSGNPNQTPRQYAIMKAQAFAAAYDGDAVTSSAIDLTDNKPVALANALNSFAQAVVASDAVSKEAVAMAAIDIDTERYDYYENVDIGLLMDRVIAADSSAAVKTAANNVKTALSNMVMVYNNTGGYMGQGLSVLFPPSQTQWRYYNSTARYLGLGFAVENTSWVPMIQALLPQQSSGKTLTIKASWTASEDCDLAVMEPDGTLHLTWLGDTYNGSFSPDSTGGSSPSEETYTLTAAHNYEVGRTGYGFVVINNGYRTGSTVHVHVTVTLGVSGSSEAPTTSTYEYDIAPEGYTPYQSIAIN